jgi:predicted dehydrogenase
MVKYTVLWTAALTCLLCCIAVGGCLAAEETAKPIRVGMIGLDTSHVVMFAKMMNDPKTKGDLSGAKVVAAFPGGSNDLPISRDRVKGFTEQLKQMGVEMVDSIEALLPKVDAVMLESVDGRPHLAQARPVILAGKPLFIDKPAAASLADVVAIYNLAKEHNVPCFSCSSNRFATEVTAVRAGKTKAGKVRGCDVYGISQPLPHHSDLYFYDIHGIEMLFTMMGPGCVSVSSVQTPLTVQITGVWKDGRVGVYRGIRQASGAWGFGATVFGDKAILPVGVGGEDEAIVREIVKFFKTRKPPVDPGETFEIFAVMDAAEQSKRMDGKPVSVIETLEKAKNEAAAK